MSEAYDGQTDVWAERIKAPEGVLNALIDSHNLQIADAARILLDQSLSTLEESLSGMLATGDCDWYVEPAKKSCASVNRLSKGFAMAASQMAEFFDDIYVGQDIRDVLLNPDTGSQNYPNTIAMSSGYFLKTIDQHLPEIFWDANQEFQDTQSSLSFVGDFAANEQTMSETTPLICLYEAQKLSRIMPEVAKALKEKGHVNLATIAECYGRKGVAMSADIISRVKHAMNRDQSIDLNAAPSDAS